MLWHIDLLGSFGLTIDGAPVATVSPRLQSLLAYLLLHHAPVSRQQLAFTLWPDTPESQARTNLRKSLLQLRKLFPAWADVMSEDGTTLQWRDTPAGSCDVAEFKRAIEMHDLKRAVEMYRGDLLPDCYDEWVTPEREHLRQLHTDALAGFVTALEAKRDYATAIDYAYRLLAQDPLDETTYRTLMRLHAIRADRAGALRVYRQCVDILRKELGAAPERATREQYEQLTSAAESAPGQVKGAAPGPLVGRVEAWQRLRAAWMATSDGPQCAIIAGEAGIGKTRLAEEMIEWAGRQGIVTATARCYAAEGALAYAPVSMWLRTIPIRQAVPSLDPVMLTEVARLLPELLAERPGLRRPGPLTEAWQRQRLFEALARAVLNTRRPLVLLLDDLQWADRETLEWLRFLLRFEPHARLLLIGTVRTEEVTGEHPLNSLMLALRRAGGITEIDLGPLTASETASLAAHITGRLLEPAQITHLYHETEGNPLFVVEAVRSGDWETETGGDSPASSIAKPRSLPLAVQAVITRRLGQLSPDARGMAGLAATAGGEFSLDVLAKASNKTDEALAGDLEELLQRRIIRERITPAGTALYDFSHDKIRETAYRSLSAARHKLLHRRVAEALEEVHPNDLDAISGQVAAHFDQAGMAEQALTYYTRAAEASRRVFANDEAIRYYRRAIELLAQFLPNAPARLELLLASIHESLGDILALVGRYTEAQAEFELALTQATSDMDRGRLHRKVANTFVSRREFERAAEVFGQADAMLGPEPRWDDAAWRHEWLQVQTDHAMLNYWRGRSDEIIRLVERMRPVVEHYGTPTERAGFYQALTLLDLRIKRYVATDETLHYTREHLAAQQQLDSPHGLAFAQFMNGFVRMWTGDLAGAEEWLRVSLATAGRIGDVTICTRCLNYLSVIQRKRGDVEQVQSLTEQTLLSAARADMPEYTAQATSNQAWVAWKRGRFGDAEDIAQRALALFDRLLAGFAPAIVKWEVYFPELDMALRRGDIAHAVSYAQEMLHPSQQRLPDELTTELENAIRAFGADEQDLSRQYLQQSTVLAQQLGYL